MIEFLLQALAFFPIDKGARPTDRPDALLQLRGQIAGALLGGEQDSQLLAQNGVHSGVLHEDAGKHVRAAVGVNTLPLDAAVEIEFIFTLADAP